MNFGPEIFEAWCYTWNTLYAGDRVNRVISGNKWFVLFLKRACKGLLFSWDPENPGLSLNGPSSLTPLLNIQNPVTPFGHFVRKHLQNVHIGEALHLEADRILKLKIQKRVAAGFVKHMSLVFEISGPRSNIIILDSQDHILDSAISFSPGSNKFRTVFRGFPYYPPPPFCGIKPSDFLQGPDPGDLHKIKGIGKALISEILNNWDLNTPSDWAKKINHLYTYAQFQEEEPLVQLTADGRNIIVFSEAFPDCTVLGTDPLDTLDGIISQGFIQKRNSQLSSLVSRMFNKERKSIERHIQGLQSQYRNALSAESFKNKGNLILSHVHDINKGQREVILKDFHHPHEEVAIVMDPALTPVENAMHFFRLYKKYKVKPEKILDQIEFLKIRLKDLEEEEFSLSILEDPICFEEVARDILSSRDRSKRTMKRSRSSGREDYLPIRKYEWDGNLIILGLNARGNRHVTFREAKGDDLWFHAYEIPGSHVILKTGKKDISERERNVLIEISASLAGYHSKGRNSGKVRVIYTQKKNVRHIPGGETAQVSYRNPSSILVDPVYWKEFFPER